MFQLLALLFAFQLSAASDVKHLAESPKWIKLLHYKKSLLGSYESQADGSGFFLSPEGKTSPLSELKANIEAFSKTERPGDDDPACHFPARVKWLNQELGSPWKIDFSGCQKYVAFFSKLAARRASIIFSSYYLSNPNSAFGHTLMRLSRYEDRSETEMLDYGINYSANSKGANPFTYAWDGLFGGFKGNFAALPYYYKIREYSDFEFRDLWSYELKLTQAEVLGMVDHIWELGHTDFDYYYFLENCSYHLLSIIDTVRPDLDLTSHYSVFAIPADTVRLLREKDLIEEGIRRESVYSKLQRLSEDLSEDEKRLARSIAKAPATTEDQVRPLEPKRGAAVLDLAMEAFDYFNSEMILKDDAKTMEAKAKILRARALNPTITPNAQVKTNPKDSPALGHAPTRYFIGEGYRHGQGLSTQLQWRAAMHDLLDPPRGSLKSAELEMAKVTLSVRERAYRDPKLILQDLTVLNLKNYAAQSFWSSPLSWEIEAGLRGREGSTCFDCPETQLLGAVGNAWDAGPWFFAFLLGGELNFQSSYDRGYRLGLGPKLVSRLTFSEKWLLGFTTWYQVEAYGPNHLFTGSLELRHHLSEKLSLVLKGQADERQDSWVPSGLLGLQVFH